MNKKKIIFVLPSMAGGGAEKVASILLNNLSREKYNLRLVLFNKKGEYLEDLATDIGIFDLNKKSKWDFFMLILRLRDIIKSEKPDVLISFLQYANIITVLSSLFVIRKPKVIVSARAQHRMYLPHAKLKLLRLLLMKVAYKKASLVVVIAKGIKDAIIEDFRIASNKIVVIYNPVEIKKIEELSKEEVGHPFMKNKNNIPVIISAGRLTAQKNFNLLIKAFISVRNIMPVHLIILGQGALKDELQMLAKELHVEQYIDLVGFQKNPYAWMKKADLFVLSSSWEGFGNVIIEAMACGVPVISTDCPSGPNEIITNYKNGVLVPVQDKRALASAILRLLKEIDLRKKISHEGKRRSQDFESSKILAQYEALF